MIMKYAHPELFDELAVALRGNVESMNNLPLQGICVGYAPTNAGNVTLGWKEKKEITIIIFAMGIWDPTADLAYKR